MGFSGTYKSGEGDALFEVTFAFNPEVAVRYFLSVDGFWHHLWSLVLTVCWLVFGVSLQLSLAAYFPELPLYPLPIVVCYLSWTRSSYVGLLCGLSGSLLLDALLFVPVGTSSWIMFFVCLWCRWLRESLGAGSWHLGYWGMLLGGGSVCLYVLGKLVLLGFGSGGNAVVSLLFHELLLGSLLGGACLSPLLFWLFAGVERLMHVTRRGGGAVHVQA